MYQKIKRKWLVFPLMLVFSILAFLINKGVFSIEKDPVPAAENPKNMVSTFAVDIPSELEFAGEPVPLDQQDIHESLDREMLVNTYFHSQTILYIKRANRHFPTIEKILKRYDIPDDFKYLALAESGLTQAVSPAGAVGFWQILEGTAKEYGLEVNGEIDERYHIEKSTEAACKYLLQSYKTYGNWTMAAASYNAGRRGIDRQVDRQKAKNYYDLLLTEETSRYIFRILSYKLILSDPSSYGFHIGKNELYPVIPVYEVTIDDAVPDFADFARRYGINYKILKLFNPWLREPFLLNKAKKTYLLSIPREGYFDPSRAIQE
jgi:membrane-bound lytic murein transglycosylase D